MEMSRRHWKSLWSQVWAEERNLEVISTQMVFKLHTYPIERINKEGSPEFGWEGKYQQMKQKWSVQGGSGETKRV